MAQPNKLRITRNAEELEVLVTDNEGEVHDITAKFREIAGSTSPSGFANTFKAQANGTIIEVNFTAIDKELNYTLPAETAKQLASLAD